jgi:hypothetical protein
MATAIASQYTSTTRLARVKEREALAQKVAAAFARLADHKEDIERLWQEFANLQEGETIMGCQTKTEFCEKVLGRSIRAVRYMLDGGNFKRSACGQETVSPAVETYASGNDSPSQEHDWTTEWVDARMPEFVQEDSPEPYATIVFRVASKEDLNTLAEATGQALTPNTKSAWFPHRPHRQPKVSIQ